MTRVGHFCPFHPSIQYIAETTALSYAGTSTTVSDISDDDISDDSDVCCGNFRRDSRASLLNCKSNFDLCSEQILVAHIEYPHSGWNRLQTELTLTHAKKNKRTKPRMSLYLSSKTKR